MRERKRMRLIGFDYATPGAYFITAVVKDRFCFFGHIKNGTCSLSPFGQIVADQWQWLHNQYPYLTIDEFVVMPNHFHGIINITDSLKNGLVGNGRDRSLRNNHPSPDHHPQQKIKSLSELVGAFKTTSSKLIHHAGMPSFQWQKSFYERIIRNEQELNRIKEYIQMNVLRWELDIENQGNFPGVGNGRARSLQIRSVRDYYDKIIDPL
jgi:REP element-mobilizing transposase RayT